MRVICIKGVNKGEIEKKEGKIITEEYEIYEGEKYTVMLQQETPIGLCYALRERDPFFGYAANRFIPCSEQDETEIHKETLLVNTTLK